MFYWTTFKVNSHIINFCTYLEHVYESKEVKLMAQILFYKLSKSQQIEYKKRARVSIAHGHVLVHAADLNIFQFPTFRKKDMLA